MLMPLLIALLAAGASPAGDPCGAAPWLEGSVRFRGDAWAMRLHLDPRVPDSLALDLPELVMAGHRIPGECARDTLNLELPFGLGPVVLAAGSDGSFTGSSLLGKDTLSVTLAPSSPPPYDVRPIEFRNAGVTLRGSVYVPAGRGPHPAMVIAHGSGPIGRQSWAYRSWADFFARMGIAALVYDKRGVGESDGDYWTDSAFTALAGDLAAGIGAVREFPGIDPLRVGITARSQGGWVAYEAADAAKPSWMVLMAAPAVSPAEQELQRVSYGMRHAGHDRRAVDEAVAHTRLFFYTAVTGRGWSALRASSARLDTMPWAEWLQLPDSMAQLRWWRVHATVDPSERLRVSRTPTLALYSTGDPVVPAVENAGRLRELLRGGHPASRVVTLAAGDHRLEVPAGRDAEGVWHFPRVNREALETIRTWLAARRGGHSR